MCSVFGHRTFPPILVTLFYNYQEAYSYQIVSSHMRIKKNKDAV
jgi:hypothetical protein